MSSRLVEGQSFPPQFRLDRNLAATSGIEVWVATNERTGDRALVRILVEAPSENHWAALTKSVDAVRGVVHEHINLVREHGSSEGIFFLIEPYIQGATPFNVTSETAWPTLKQLIEALQYLHALGIAHGNLHPANLLIDERSVLHLTGIGIAPSWSSASVQEAFQSPQVREGKSPDLSDDIYSLGCLIYSVLTRQTWQFDAQPEAPLPKELSPLVAKMMSESSYDRTVELADVMDGLAKYFGDDTDAITALNFSRSGATTIDPQPMPQVATRQAQGISTRKAVIAAALILAGGGLLFFLLPNTVPETNTAVVTETLPAEQTVNTKAETEQAPIVAPFEAARLEFLQEEGQKVAREVLRQQLDLEDRGVRLWAREDFDAAGAELDSADDAFRNGQFEQALTIYQHILSTLEQLASRADTALKSQLETGESALIEGDYDTALTAFTIANAIEPDREETVANLRRAENLEQVIDLMRKGEMLERDNQLDDALVTYRQARDLDKKWAATSSSIARVSTAITERDFREAMSQAFQAASDQDYELARKNFALAQKVLPSSKEPTDGLAQVAQAETNIAINALREEAEALFADGNWQGAIDKYNAVLAISGALEFATMGLAESEWRKKLDEQLNKYLADPPLLQENDGLQSASALLRDAMKVDSTDSDFRRRLDSLAKLISTARIEIPVTIRSDGKTTITVRRHKQLGMVDNQIIYLIPGRYTITGERAGYRDVREDLVLIAGRPTPDINIVSTERVR